MSGFEVTVVVVTAVGVLAYLWVFRSIMRDPYHDDERPVRPIRCDDGREWFAAESLSRLIYSRATLAEHRYVTTVWDDSRSWRSRSILAQIEVSAHDEEDARRLARRLLLPEHRSRRIEVERVG